MADQHLAKFLIFLHFISFFRYSRATRGHGPLFLSPPAAGTLPKQCPHCRGEVIPEIQILPSMINALSPRRAVDTGAHGARGCPDSPSGTTVVEFGTVIVYTCLKSCWAVEGGAAATPPRSERLLVQAENM